jgi:hypothetical protein
VTDLGEICGQEVAKRALEAASRVTAEELRERFEDERRGR